MPVPLGIPIDAVDFHGEILLGALPVVPVNPQRQSSNSPPSLLYVSAPGEPITRGSNAAQGVVILAFIVIVRFCPAT
jgi:hypothetical protein